MMLGLDEPAGGGVSTRGAVFGMIALGADVPGPVVGVSVVGVSVVGDSVGTVGSGLDELGFEEPGDDVSGALVGTEGA